MFDLYIFLDSIADIVQKWSKKVSNFRTRKHWLRLGRNCSNPTEDTMRELNEPCRNFLQHEIGNSCSEVK